jgi:hypothetical protein
MRLIVCDENSKLLGTVGFDRSFTFFGQTDHEFKNLVKNLEQSGIPVMVRKAEDKNITYLEETVSGNSPSALFALREHLKSIGYSVDDYHEETVEELTKILGSWDDCEEKNDLLKRIPTMSYLQQTTMLQELKSALPK